MIDCFDRRCQYQDRWSGVVWCAAKNADEDESRVTNCSGSGADEDALSSHQQCLYHSARCI